MRAPSAKQAVRRALREFGITPRLSVRRGDWLSSDARPLVIVRTVVPPSVADAVRDSLPGVRVVFAASEERGAA